jgi:hypothetical protein
MPSYSDHNATSPMHAPLIGAMLSFLQSPLRGAREVLTGGGSKNPAAIFAPGKATRLAGLEIERRRRHFEQSGELSESRSRRLPGSVVFDRQAFRGGTSVRRLRE